MRPDGWSLTTPMGVVRDPPLSTPLLLLLLLPFFTFSSLLSLFPPLIPKPLGVSSTSLESDAVIRQGFETMAWLDASVIPVSLSWIYRPRLWWRAEARRENGRKANGKIEVWNVIWLFFGPLLQFSVSWQSGSCFIFNFIYSYICLTRCICLTDASLFLFFIANIFRCSYIHFCHECKLKNTRE